MRKDILEFVKELSLSDPKTLSQKSLKLFEEGGELAKAILPYESASGTLHRIVHRGHILEEVVDSILVALSVAYSLGFEDDEIASMMHRKSMYWAGLQANESNVISDKIPHEIHVTVKSASDIESFRKDCQSIGVKPIVLALHTKSDGVITDVMTSQVIIGSTTDAFHAMKDTNDALSRLGYNVSRCKIEAAPWHPSAPTDANQLSHGKDNYFESHVEVKVCDSEGSNISMARLKECLEQSGATAHLSNNYFKSFDEIKTVMVTLRRYDGTFENFSNSLNLLKATLTEWGFSYNNKDIVEYSIYDSNTSHDEEWMR